MGIFKKNMLIFVGVFVISTNLIEITKAIRSINYIGAPQGGVEVVCSPEDPRVYNLNYANQESSEFNDVDGCKPQKDYQHNINGDGLGNMAPQSPKEDKSIVTSLPYMN
ncbi:unnamed protein product [Citrullus colocynthis]|uniref:Uncharacterized protein n=1 Tax=Citrullus colocynthis TaxID=252529 RepID=A0ABP0Y605_9ROSI